MITDQPLFVRGSTEVIDGFVERLDGADLALGILGNPLSDFAGLPVLLRALERRRIAAEIVPGMPRATLSAAITMPLVPLPPGSSHQNWDDLVEIMARLRRSCPWDREQTHASLVRYLIEETYEVVDAIEGGDETELCEELGDLLFQVVFHAQLATERGKFSIADVVDALSNKMVRRHPHVFGDVAVASVAEVWQNWDQLKAQEASARVAHARSSTASPTACRRCSAARRCRRKRPASASIGPTRAQITEKLAEELREFADARCKPGRLGARGSARARRARRRAVHGRQPRAQAQHRRRGRDARRQREVRPPLPLHGAVRARQPAANSAT